MVKSLQHSASVLALALCLPGISSAQEAETERPEQSPLIDLIVVTADDSYRGRTAVSASRLDVPLEETPLNVQVITGEVISDFGLLTQRDALQFHAAVDDKRVRGFNTSEFFRNGFIHLSDVPGFAIQRLEIVRGATAVLNGPVTPGGAINVLTKKAQLDQDFGEAGGYWGFSEDGRDNNGASIDINVGTIGPEADYGSIAAFRFVGGWQGDTGFATSVDNELYAILPTLQLRPFKNTFIELEYYTYEISTDRTDRPMGIELTIPGEAPGQEIPLSLAYGIDPRSTWFGSTTDIRESLDDWSISITQLIGEQFIIDLSYNRHSRDFEFGPGNRPRIDIFYPTVLRDGAPAGSTDPDDYLIRRLTEDLSLTNDIDQFSALFTYLPGWGDEILDHRFVFGADYYDQTQFLTIMRPRESGQTSGFFFEFFEPGNVATDNLDFNAAGNDVFFTTVLDRERGVTQSNFFANYHGKFFNDRLSVLLGIYYSDIEITQINLRSSPLQEETIADSSEWLPQAGAVLEVIPQISLYANYSESQLPDLNDPDFERAPPVRQGEQIEAGFRFNLFDGRVISNLGFFWIDETLDGETQREAEAQGIDFDAFILPTDNWSIVLSYAYADTEITGGSNPDVIGDPLVDEVPNKAAIWTKYDFMDGTLEGLSLGGGLIWTGRRVRPTAAAAQAVKKLDGEILRFDAETRLDLFAIYTGEFVHGTNYQVSLNLRNLTKDANISNVVPRVPLQGGVKPNGDPYVFDGSREVLLGAKIFY